MSPSRPRRIVVGITGASGAVYAVRVLQLLLQRPLEVHLVISPLGQRLLHDELGLAGTGRENLLALLGCDQNTMADKLVMHPHRDVGAAIASGSFVHDGMVVIPCSSNTLSAIATGSAQNLIHRAAYVTLKERRPLVLVHREMPLTLIDARHMAQLMEAGAIVAPANPGFYMGPQTISDLVDFVVGRVLDLLRLDHDLPVRWAPDHQKPDGAMGDADGK